MSGNLLRNLAALSLAVLIGGPISAGERQGKKPPSPSDIADKIIKAGNKQLEDADRIKYLKAKHFNNTLREVELAPKEEQRITESFLIITQRRRQTLDPKETAILRALESFFSANYEGAKFKEVIEDLQEKLKVAIIVHEDSLREASVDYDTTVNLKVPKKIQGRTILRAVLGSMGLGYFVKEGTIHVVTAKQARETMVMRTYPIGDLVAPDPRLGPINQQVMRMLNVQSIINFIKNSSGDPALWEQDGGSIEYSFLQGQHMLRIRAPAEMHYMMPSTFNKR